MLMSVATRLRRPTVFQNVTHIIGCPVWIEAEFWMRQSGSHRVSDAARRRVHFGETNDAPFLESPGKDGRMQASIGCLLKRLQKEQHLIRVICEIIPVPFPTVKVDPNGVSMSYKHILSGWECQQACRRCKKQGYALPFIAAKCNWPIAIAECCRFLRHELGC